MTDVYSQQPTANTFRRGFLTSPSFVVFLLAISVCGYSVVRALESSRATHIAAAADVEPADHVIPAQTVVQPSPETAGGNRPYVGRSETRLTPIETLQVGQRVRADAPTDEVDRQFGDEVIPADWRKLTLTAPKRDGSVSDVVLLRPLDWIAQQQAEVDGQVYIAVPECDIDGNATVHSIEPCPPITQGHGRVITGTFRHRVAGGIELSVAGESQPIRCTGNHPIWSETRQDFVRADSLQPGESLRTTTGLTQVVSTTSLRGETYVYNLEVHGQHVYHVGKSGILVHNGDPCPEELWDIETLLANGRRGAPNGGTRFLHGSDIDSVDDIIRNKLDPAKARAKGGGTDLWTVGERNVDGARLFAEVNPSEGSPAILQIDVPDNVLKTITEEGALATDVLEDGTEVFRFSEEAWDILNEFATFRRLE